MILGSRIDPSFNSIQTIPISYVSPEQLEKTPHISRTRLTGGTEAITNDLIQDLIERIPEDYADVLGIRFYCVPTGCKGARWHADIIIFQKNIHVEHIPVWKILNFDQAVEFLGMEEVYYQ